MNLTRRKFFRGLAVAPVVAFFVAKLPALLPDNTSLILTKWTRVKYIGHTTIHGGLSEATWRRLYQGVQPLYTIRSGLHPKQWLQLSGIDPTPARVKFLEVALKKELGMTR